MPGWNEYEAAGEVVNAEDVEGGEAQDLIKILGPREAAAACAAQLSVRYGVQSNLEEIPNRPPRFSGKPTC